MYKYDCMYSGHGYKLIKNASFVLEASLFNESGLIN